MGKLLVVNGSPHTNGNTAKALTAVAEALAVNYDYTRLPLQQLPQDFRGCRDCGPGNCVPHCRFFDDVSLQALLGYLEDADAMLLGSPVYLDMPTPQVVAFLTRLNCMAEPTGRTFFPGKSAYLLATGYCSGTKAVIRTMMGACEMLGFDIPGRSTYEYIVKWNDRKIRGGQPGPGIWMPE
jgi:multimeric flavodoxin WrbA